MAVRVNDRKDGDLLVIVKAKEHLIYAMRVTSNENHFPKRYRLSIVKSIQEKAIDIMTCLIEANETYPKTKAEYENRKMLQKKAAAQCRSLLTLIDVSKELFGISTKTIQYWSGTLVDIRRMTIAWMQKDGARFKEFYGK